MVVPSFSKMLNELASCSAHTTKCYTWSIEATVKSRKLYREIDKHVNIGLH